MWTEYWTCWLFCRKQNFKSHLYADDIVLLSPSIIGLRRLLNICEKYADDFDITFNSNKCKCITFCSGRLPFIVGKVVFCQTELCWCDEITYLGVKLSCNLDDRNEILSQLRNFYARSNLVIRRFYKCSTSVKLRLFHAFCCNIYLYQVWLSFPKFIINRFRVARNNCLRKLIGLPYHCSASEMHVFYRVDDFDGSLRKARALMYLRLVRTQNSYVESYLNSEEFLSSKFRLILLEQTLVWFMLYGIDLFLTLTSFYLLYMEHVSGIKLIHISKKYYNFLGTHTSK